MIEQIVEPRVERRGGYRPGSGRKSGSTKVYQAARRQQLQDIVTAQEWARVVRGQLESAVRGSTMAAQWLASYVIGNEPIDIQVNGELMQRVVNVIYQRADPDHAISARAALVSGADQARGEEV